MFFRVNWKIVNLFSFSSALMPCLLFSMQPCMFNRGFILLTFLTLKIILYIILSFINDIIFNVIKKICHVSFSNASLPNLIMNFYYSSTLCLEWMNELHSLRLICCGKNVISKDPREHTVCWREILVCTIRAFLQHCSHSWTGWTELCLSEAFVPSSNCARQPAISSVGMCFPLSVVSTVYVFEFKIFTVCAFRYLLERDTSCF